MLFDNSLHLVSFDIISKGVTNFAPLSQRKILESIIKSNAASALIAHNHPNGTSIPSRPDAHATIGVRNLLKGFNVELLDHIVVGEDDYVSMASSKDYRDIFDDDKQKEALEALLKVKKTPKKKSKSEIRLKEIITYEKAHMLPLNFTVAYILTPIYAILCFLLI